MSTGADLSSCQGEAVPWPEAPALSSNNHLTIRELMRFMPRDGLRVLEALPMHLSPPRATIMINLSPCDGVTGAKSCFPTSLQPSYITSAQVILL